MTEGQTLAVHRKPVTASRPLRDDSQRQQLCLTISFIKLGRKKARPGVRVGGGEGGWSPDKQDSQEFLWRQHSVKAMTQNRPAPLLLQDLGTVRLRISPLPGGLPRLLLGFSPGELLLSLQCPSFALPS